MNEKLIKEFEQKSIFDRMAIHEDLLEEEDVSVLEEYFVNFGGKNAIIAQALAANPNTPSIILEELGKVERYLKNVLSNPNTPTEIVDRYATHDEFVYRICVLENPKLAKETLDLLCEDELGMVMWAARDKRKQLQGENI